LLPREAELAAQFFVSRQAVREGLKVLAAKGLVYSRRRVGTAVLPRSSWNLLDPDVLAWHAPDRLPADFLRQLVELRRVIEPAAAEMAAMRGGDENVAAIGAALTQMHRTAEDPPAFIRADLDFHIAIFVASGNVLFDRLGRICEPALGASFAAHLASHDATALYANTLPHHDAIYAAIRDRDPLSARRQMDALLADAAREIDSPGQVA
jgi:DNA-binding FadR family transcriptional regulator